jgi:hypothetical protein
MVDIGCEYTPYISSSGHIGNEMGFLFQMGQEPLYAGLNRSLAP